ncbi:unnamed protein product, partial [Arabidopsis halleri]
KGPPTIRCKFSIPTEVYDFFESVRKYIPGPILGMIISSKPDDAQIEIVDDTCWAIVVAELISALRFILKYDATYTDYSAQYLVDYADQSKGLMANHSRKEHYCYTHSIAKGLEFVKHGGIPLAKHWKYVGCRKPTAYRPPKDHSHVRIASVQRRSSVDEALPHLEFHPIGAALAIFQPDYLTIKEGIYRGPMSKGSIYKGLHAVSIYGIDEENGETIALVKSSHGEDVGRDGYFRVSLDIMMIEVPWEGQEAHPNFKRPTKLLTGFCFP